MEVNMSVFAWYMIFALTTGIVTYLELFRPVIEEIKLLTPEDMIAQSPVLSVIVAILLGAVFAPFFILPCLIPSLGNVVREGLAAGMRG